MESPGECDPTSAAAAAALEREATAAEEEHGAHLASESGEVSQDAPDVRGGFPAFMPQHGAETAAAGEPAEEGAAAVDPTAAAVETLAFDSRGGVADDALADAVSSPREEISSEAAAEGQQRLQQEGTGTAAAEGEGQQLFDEQAGAEAAVIPGALLSEEQAADAAAAAGEDEGADDIDEEGSAAAAGAAGGSGGAEAEEGKQLFEEEREQTGADSDAEREERRRQKRERREKKREKKRRRKEKKKKKKKQFAEDEAEESEGNEEAAEAAADAAADDVERDLLGDAKGEDEEASPRAAVDGLLSSRDREATAAAELQQRRGGTAAAAGGGRGGKTQRRAAEDRHVAFFERDETARRGRSEDGDAGSERDDEGRKRTVTAFDRALERIRLRKKRRFPLSNEECSLYCNKLLQQMSDAMQADMKAMEEGRPATAKLEMLDFACAELVKPKWRHWFLAEGCCQCIAAWLAPLKDNSLSNFTLRNKLLHVLAKLPITSQDLQSNDLGRVLVLLWDHPEEGDANRVLIRQLIQRWTRPMLGLGSSHREFLQERDRALEANDLELQQKLVAAANANQAASQNEDTDETKYRRARIPVNAGHNFLIQPKSYVTGNEQSSTRGAREGPSHFSSRLLGRIGGDRTARRATRASKLFLEGRNL